MRPRFTRTDYILWSVIAVYTAVIYSTLSLVSIMRKALENRFGSQVYDSVYWVFGAIVLVVVFYLIRNLRGRRLAGSVAILAAIGLVYWYYLSTMDYPVEKLHFLEYGLLGALLLAAFRRHFAQWVAVLCGLAVVYWIGLGDEAIQWVLPNRVGEIRDSVINLFSGVLGIGALHFTVYAYRASLKASRAQVRTVVALGMVTTVLTALFLAHVHGFGHVVETKQAGRIYSSFRGRGLQRINTSGFLNERERQVYENEALRHLHQREFYFTNDFRIKDGGFYRMYDRAQFENTVLETHYRRYLDDHADMCAGELLANKDKEVAEKTMKQPLVWPDSLKTWFMQQVGTRDTHYHSRVKSTIITTYSLRDLLFYVALILAMLGYAWWRLGRELEARKQESGISP